MIGDLFHYGQKDGTVPQTHKQKDIATDKHKSKPCLILLDEPGQVFINYSDNSRLDSSGFSPFGKVVSGLEVAEAAMNPTPGERGGVGQGLLEDRGNGWIRSGREGRLQL